MSVLTSIGTALLIALTPAQGATSGEPENAAAAVKADAAGLTQLGDTYIDGNGVPRDLARAVSYYEQAAALGSAKAMWRLGDALVEGEGVKQDLERGIALLRNSAALGSSGALLSLAQLQEKGQFGEASRLQSMAMYEQAAALGRPVALIKLGQLHDKGEIVPRDTAKAEAYYRQAMAVGRMDAAALLGKLLVARPSSTTEGIAVLEKALKSGDPMAAVYLADCYIKSCRTARDPAGGLTLLKTALEAGNLQAGLRLVAIYRDGEKGVTKKDRTLADFYLHQMAAGLDGGQVAFQRLLLNAASARSLPAYEAARVALSQLPDDLRPAAVRKMRVTNPNAYVYLLQHKLRELDQFSGTPTGTLSDRTVRAIVNYCSKHLKVADCGKGPMTPAVAEVMAAAF